MRQVVALGHRLCPSQLLLWDSVTWHLICVECRALSGHAVGGLPPLDESAIAPTRHRRTKTWKRMPMTTTKRTMMKKKTELWTYVLFSLLFLVSSQMMSIPWTKPSLVLVYL